jgi:PKD repeat protein
MSSTPSAPAAPPAKKSFLRTILIGVFGLGTGTLVTYATAIFDSVVKPLPVANFSVAADGLAITAQNHASGDNGWWDFGDGSPLEPFAADQPQVLHTYASPGTYSVKLIVRNVLGKENDRSVNVDVKTTTKDEPPAPVIAGFNVTAVSPANMAPATFKVAAEVTHADHVVFDLGDGRVEVAESGKVEKLVTFDKAGSFPIQLVALNGKSAVKQSSSVKVDAPPDGTLMAVVTITDGGSQMSRHSRNETMVVPAPRDKTMTFSRNVWARPGHTLVDAKLTKPDVPDVKDLKLTISADKRSAAISGEFVNQTAGKVGADVLIPLSITEEHPSRRAPGTMHASAALQMQPGNKATAVIPLPPLSANTQAVSRKIDVEVRQIGPGGKNYVVAAGPLVGRSSDIPAKNVWSPPNAAVTKASYDIASVKIDFAITSAAPGPVVPAGGPVK